MRILIIGLSTRAIAESAVRGSHRYSIVTLDYFGDRDQRALVQNYGLQRDFALPFSAAGLLHTSRCLDFDAVVYNSNLENYPKVVEELARRAVLLGNAPSVLRRVRDWRELRSFCHAEAISYPTTLLPGEEKAIDLAEHASPYEESKVIEPPTLVRWLRKPIRSGSGHGIQFWAGEPLDKAHILQAYIEGQPASAAFVADGQRCVLLGLTEQIIGQQELGARDFTWCGNILPLDLPRPEFKVLVRSVREMVEKLTRSFGLRGVNGVDFVLGHTLEKSQVVPYLVEVNPRYTASMELIEWAYDLNIFDLHLQALEGKLPSFSLEDSIDLPGFYGKAIVYARTDVVMPETVNWRAKGRRDIPFPGEQIEARHPICTVLAQGRTRDECWDRLLAAAEEVRRESSDLRG